MRIPAPLFRSLLTVLVVIATSSVASAQLQPKTGDPLPGLTPDELTRYLDGKVIFDDPKSEAEGLGPIHNETSCGACHNSPSTGGSGSVLVTRFGNQPKGGVFDPMEDLGGSLLQALGISLDCEETLPPSANVVASRVTPLSVGLGLIEAIPDSVLESQALAGTGIVHWVPTLEDPLGPLRAGRFGWKAQVATVMSFSGDALLNEMGITNPLVMAENAPNGDAALLLVCDTVADPEEDQGFLNALTDFQRFSAPPPQTPRSGMTGELVFADIGCADCHLSAGYTTPAGAEAALSGVSFKPYSDFLLHDMGGLGDGITQGDATGELMRTPALWGLRLRDPLIHDGRVAAGSFESRVTAAINAHGGVAFSSVQAFNALTPTEVQQLVAFLDSLGRLEFDVDDNSFINEDDLADFLACVTGPGGAPITPDDPCAIHDVDQDGDVDIDDLALFAIAYEGGLVDCDGSGVSDLVEILQGDAPDCNQNLIPDSCDIASGLELDGDGDGIPDSCGAAGSDFVRGDCNTDGDINIADVIRSLDFSFAGGTALDCAQACDTNSDGAIDIADPVFSLAYQFSSGPAMSAPFPDCGPAPRPTVLECNSFPSCP